MLHSLGGGMSARRAISDYPRFPDGGFWNRMFLMSASTRGGWHRESGGYNINVILPRIGRVSASTRPFTKDTRFYLSINETIWRVPEDHEARQNTSDDSFPCKWELNGFNTKMGGHSTGFKCKGRIVYAQPNEILGRFVRRCVREDTISNITTNNPIDGCVVHFVYIESTELIELDRMTGKLPYGVRDNNQDTIENTYLEWSEPCQQQY